MKSTPRAQLCCGLSAGLLILSRLAVATDAAAASDDLHRPAAELITYPAPEGITPSPLYSVHVGGSGQMRSSFVYRVNNIGLAQYNWQGHGWSIRSELSQAAN